MQLGLAIFRQRALIGSAQAQAQELRSALVALFLLGRWKGTERTCTLEMPKLEVFGSRGCTPTHREGRYV